ncbi:MAG: DUF2029 domain-containing protein, partial [Bradyrhizobium sp.]|nr:DUF2029 domain-containing protein [Bradyrhizobium sp.]
FFVRHGLACGFRDYEISALGAAWIVPLLSRSVAGLTTVPLGLMVLIALFALTLLRAQGDRASEISGHARIAQA